MAPLLGELGGGVEGLEGGEGGVLDGPGAVRDAVEGVVVEDDGGALLAELQVQLDRVRPQLLRLNITPAW